MGARQLDYEVRRGWERLPEGWSFVEVAGVATDSRDNVFVFNRGDHPMIVFDRDGEMLDAWGDDIFTNPHGLFIDRADLVYCTDNGDHTVRVFTTGGELVRTLGRPGEASDTGFEAWSSPVQHGGDPFNMVTNAAVGPTGDLYVSDGYGNSRVHVFSPEGALRFSWGEPGTGPGQFRLPHAIAIDRRGMVYVADRENSRIQLFDRDGGYLDEWDHVERPDDLYIDADENLYVAELGHIAGKMPPGFEPPPPRHEPHARVTVLTLDGEVQARLGGPEPCEPGSFFAPHGIWADSHGDLYVGEVIASGGGRQGLVPLDCHSLQKFVRLR